MDDSTTRNVLIEKAPLRVRVKFYNVTECEDWWYAKQYGEIFDVKPFDPTKLFNKELLKEHGKELYDMFLVNSGPFIDSLIQKKHCQILSGR